MFKVLVVDDELWIRRGIINLVDWEELGFAPPEESEDGEEALQIIENNPPHLVLMDMRMPGLDGKELIRKLNGDYPDLLVIVISGYDDFEYTYEAIKYQAFDYLLKPVRREKLVEILAKAVQKLNSLQEEANTQKKMEDWDFRNEVKQFIFQKDFLIRRTILDKYESMVSLFNKETDKMVCVAQLDDFNQYHSKEVKSGKIKDLKQSLMKKLSDSKYRYVLLENEMQENMVVLIIYYPSLEREEIDKLLSHVITDLRSKPGESASFGVSLIINDPFQLQQAYFSAEQALKKRTLEEKGRLYYEKDSDTEDSFIYPQEKEHEFLLTLKSGETEKVLYQFEQFCQSLCKKETSVGFMQKGFTILLHSMEKLLNSYNKSLENFTDEKIFMLDNFIKNSNSLSEIKQLYHQLVINISEWFHSTSYGQGKEVARQVIKTIERNYFRPISLSEIADDYYVNADYLSRLFKKETNQNFVEYVTEFRIEKAKELLRHEKYKNYEIAEMVGYENYRYFSQIFKKKVGTTIGEYRKKLSEQGSEQNH